MQASPLPKNLESCSLLTSSFESCPTMMTSDSAPETKITLLFVCVPEELIEAALDAADKQQWTVTRATFDQYISQRRRPHMPDALRSGNGCIALINFDTDPEQGAAAADYLQQVFND